MRKIGIAVACALAASGCAHTGQSFSLSPAGPEDQAPALTNRDVTRSTDAMESALGALYTRASLFEEPKRGSAEWDKVILAGMDHVDDGCNEYLTAVYIAARNDKKALRRPSSIARSFQESGASQAAFSSPEAAEKAAAGAPPKQREKRSLGLEAALFHASNEDSRNRYRRKVFAPARQAARREKFGALAALRGYLALCSPARVEAQLLEAAEGRKRRGR